MTHDVGYRPVTIPEDDKYVNKNTMELKPFDTTNDVEDML
jgi:hypothetical protein